MALPATEAFTDTNGVALTTHSASWTYNNGTFTIQSNAVVANAGGDANDGVAHWNADTFGNDQYSQGVGIATFVGAYRGVAVRCHASAWTAYFISVSDTDGPYLNKAVTGTVTTIASVGLGYNLNDVLRLEVSGTTLTALQNGSQWAGLGPQTDTAIASGYAGIAGAVNDSRGLLDTWEGGNLGGAAAANQAAFLQPMGIFH